MAIRLWIGCAYLLVNTVCIVVLFQSQSFRARAIAGSIVGLLYLAVMTIDMWGIPAWME